jgi:hypothetical protein
VTAELLGSATSSQCKVFRHIGHPTYGRDLHLYNHESHELFILTQVGLHIHAGILRHDVSNGGTNEGLVVALVKVDLVQMLVMMCHYRGRFFSGVSQTKIKRWTCEPSGVDHLGSLVSISPL